MERFVETPGSHRLNTQLFNVVGPAYIPVYLDEFGTATVWPAAERRLLRGPRRWLVLGILAVLVVCAAHLGVKASTRHAKPAPVVEVSGGMLWSSAIGGLEANRW